MEELRRACLIVFHSFHMLRNGQLRYLDPEGRRKMGQALDLRAEVSKGGNVTLRASFPQQLNLSYFVEEHMNHSAKPETEAPEGLRIVLSRFVALSATAKS